MNKKYIFYSPVATIIIFTLLLLFPGRAPAVDLSIYNVEGSVEHERDDQQLTPAAGESIRPGDILRTDEAATVSIVIPGASYLELAPETELIAHDMAQRTEERGLLFFREEVDIRDLNFELPRGEVRSTAQEDPEAELELELMTPNAVLGVRGTTFDALSRPGEYTETGVLEGEVEFMNRADLSRRVTVGRRRQSRLGVDEVEPSVPEEIAPGREKKLARHRERATRGLRRPPEIDRSLLDGDQLEEHVQISYNRPRSLQLSGSVRPGDTEVAGVRVKIDGAIISPDVPIRPAEVIDPGEPDFPRDRFGADDQLFPGADWQFEWLPEQPEEGSSREHIITVQALGIDGLVSREVNYKLELVHAAEDFPWPSGLKEGEVPLEVEYIASTPGAEVEFPFHIYEGDLQDGRVEVELSGSGPSLLGMAYSTDNGRTWQVSDFGAGRILRLEPELLGTGDIHLVGWTEETIGFSVSLGDLLGEIVYTPLRYEDLWRRLVADFVSHMERREDRELAEIMDDDFILVEHGEENRDKDLFLNELIREQFSHYRGFRLRQNIQRLHGGRDGAQVVFDFEMEYAMDGDHYFRFDDDYEYSGDAGSISYNSLQDIRGDLVRHPDGRYRFVYIEPRELNYREIFWRRRRINEISEPYPIWPAWGKDPDSEVTFNGTDIVTIETNMDGGSYGIQKLEDLNSWADVGSIPRTDYNSHVYWEYDPGYDGGDFYALRLAGSDFRATAVFEIVDYDEGVEIELKITTAVGMSGIEPDESFYFIHNFRNREPR